MKSSWTRLDEFIGRLEKGLIVILLSVMVLVAFSQIIMRNALSTGLSWGEPLVRYLVLWVAFIGAALATREDKHITIELFSVWKSRKANRFFTALSHLSAAIVCGLLALAAVKFLWFESQMGGTTLFSLPVWVPELVMPLTFGLMSIRYLIKTLAAICRWPEDSQFAGSREDS